MKRRELIQAMRGTALGGLLIPAAGAQAGGQPGRGRLFDVTAFGAAGSGQALATDAINRAIDTCAAAGGGVAYVPPGQYLTGTLVLKSNVTLYLEAGATILGSKDIAHYRLHEGPPVKGDANQKHLIFARDAVNVGLAGPGRIDGQGQSFWAPSGRVKPGPEDAWKDVATYDWKPLDRASPLLEFVNCTNLRIEDVTIENASGWTLRPIGCRTVFIRGIVINNPVHGPNTDGIDPTCCQDVFISDCNIFTGDDCICLKSENPYGPMRPNKNFTITNCVLSCCCNGLKFGTATRGGFENITFSNCVIYNDRVDERARVISGIALEVVDGGYIDGVVISNVRMQNVRTPIFIRLGNRGGGQQTPAPGTLRGVVIDGIHATGSIVTSSITGLPGHDVEDVTLSDIRIDSEETGKAEWAEREIPELPRSYPEARMFGRLPSYGLYCRHVRGLRLDNVRVASRAQDQRPALAFDDVKDLTLAGLAATAPAAAQPVVRMTNVRGGLVKGCQAPAESAAFLRVEGEATSAVRLLANDLASARRAVDVAGDVPGGAVVQSGNLLGQAAG